MQTGEVAFARREILTTYAMLGFKLFKKLSYESGSSVFYVFQTLADAFLCRA